MLSRSSLTCVLAVVVQLSLFARADAGPCLEWLFGCGKAAPSYPIGGPVPLGAGYGAGFNPGYGVGYGPVPAQAAVPAQTVPAQAGVPGYAAGFAPSYSVGSANYGTYYGMSMPAVGPAGAGYPTAVPSGITAATVPAPVFPATQPPIQPQPMSFVPNYDSRALRAPVTYYRPLMTTDPNTGAQVVAMAPCTSYQYLTQRVPTFGQSALYGSYQTPSPPQRTIPTYSLPSGGVPIAQSSSSMVAPHATLGYGPYTTYQPALAAPSSLPGAVQTAPGYATTPITSTPYYSAPNGGSSGTIYSAPIPGLSAPPSTPYSSTPNYSAPAPASPGYSTPASPGYSTPAPALPGFSAPSSNPVLPGSDPADMVPSLPQYNGQRPQLQSIVPDVGGIGNESASTASPKHDTSSASEKISRELPVMSPIPAPEGLDKPRWNPGLLREEDMTALRPVTRFDQYASRPSVQPTQLIQPGQSKKIVWTSFENSNSENALVTSGSIDSNPDERQRLQQSEPKTVAPTAKRRYDNGGWKASK